MSPTNFSRCILLILLFTTCTRIVHGKGGRGGGSRGGGSRGGGGWGRSSSSRSSSSSHGSSSSSSSSGYSSKHGSSSSSGGGSSIKYGSSSSSGGGSSIKYGSSSSSGGGSSVKYGLPSSIGGGSSSNHDYSSFSRGSAIHSPPDIPKFKEMDAFIARQKANMNEALQAHLRVTNNRNSQLSAANYPRQTYSLKPVPSFESSQGLRSQGIPNANYPRQPISSFDVIPSHTSFSNPGLSIANYPRQPNQQQTFVPSGASTFKAIPHANYPRQPNPHQTFGSSSPEGFSNANYPRQAINPNPSAPLVRSPPFGHQLNHPRKASELNSHPQSGIPSANYPRQQFNYQSLPPQVLGSGVWNPKSGMPAPVYMNYGGLPTGANMYTKPMKKQGFLGSLMSTGSSSKSFKNKHYSSYPSPYGLGGGMPANVMGGFMGNKGSKTAMYTILPYMAARKSSKLFKPKFGFYSYMPMRHHYYHHHSYMRDPEYARVHYDVYNHEYVGRCNRPIKPDHAKVECNSTHNQVECDVTCEDGYRYPDNTTRKTNKCWHVSGTWNPTKNFPGCKPVCDEPCLNGGKCVSPGACGCTSEYRGPRCESHFLNCDIRKLANGTKIVWSCTHTKNETSCRVRCQSPDILHALQSDPIVYNCTPGGVWTPSTMPPCALTPDPEEQNVTKIPEEHVTKVIS